MMVFLMNFYIRDAKKTGIFVWVFTSSIDNLFKLLNGESSTIPAMVVSLEVCRIEVTAPIDLPHSPIRETLSVCLK